MIAANTFRILIAGLALACSSVSLAATSNDGPGEGFSISGTDPQPQAAAVVPAKAAAVARPSAFQLMVRDSLGTDLPVYGLDFFRQALDGSALNAIPATADYVLGTGDEVIIRSEGGVDINYRAFVDQHGLIFIPRVGQMRAAGMKYQDLGAAVAVEIGKKFRNFNLSVTLGQLHGAQILVVGQVAHPGSYVLPPYATAITALLAAGGPNESGSLRRITVKNGKSVKALDLYKLLADGDKGQDFRLQPGDVVLVSPVGKQAAVSGDVKKPGIFELAEGETYADLVKYAGGFTVTARPQEMRVEHIDKQARRAVSLLALPSLNRPVGDGDILRVPSVTMDYANAVTIRGAVAENMRTPWKADMRVADLIQSRDDLIVPAYWHGKNQLGEGGDNRLTSNKKTEVNWDYAVVERLNRSTMETDLLPFHLRRALEKDPANNLALQPGDVVTIFSRDQMRVPEQSRSRYVRLEGEVKSPGIYKVSADETLRSLVNRAGGLTDQAYLYGAEFYRASTKAAQQKQMDATVAKLEESVRLASAASARNATALDDVRAAKEQAAANMSMIAGLRSIQATGRIVLEVPYGRSSVGDLPDLQVEDNDKLVIPSKPSTVSVIGAVYNENTYLHKPDRSPAEYLELAGGVIAGVDFPKIMVARADGAIVRGEDVSSLKPGDAVVAMDDTSKVPFMKSLKDWAQILYQFGLAAAGVNVLK